MCTSAEAAQEKAALKRGRSYRDTFGIDDPVRIKDNGSGLWNLKGLVIDLVEGEDQVARSFLMRQRMAESSPDTAQSFIIWSRKRKLVMSECRLVITCSQRRLAKQLCSHIRTDQLIQRHIAHWINFLFSHLNQVYFWVDRSGWVANIPK